MHVKGGFSQYHHHHDLERWGRCHQTPDRFRLQLASGDQAAISNENYEQPKKLTDEMKRIFRPEFLNRLDGTVIFRLAHPS